MNPFDCVLVHYGEIALKGRNRPLFEKRLVDNIRKALRGQSYPGVERVHGRLIVGLEEASDLTAIKDALHRVFGIAWFGFAHRAENDLELIKQLVLDRVSVLGDRRTMKVVTKRSYKAFPLTSMEVNREIGSALVKSFGMRASMKAPQLEVFIEITSEGAFVFLSKERGLGGLPVGISGRVLCLLSGGIDSPVAAWLMMKRGCAVDFVHFHAFATGEEARQSKMPELLGHLSRYSFGSRLYLAPFLPFHLATLETSSKHELLLFRRFMLRVAERIAGRERLRGLVTGDSLGQVASQTLENMAVVEDAVSVPVFRPLLAYDKEEIVGLARQIGTYGHSIRPYKDCCSILARHPETKARLRFVREAERRLDMEAILRDTLDGVEVLTVENGAEGASATAA